ncbi:DUF555 domain-containing protein [Halolamina litorea]|uniref:DUF555 domain-containing protein n=1 Tax=Halolamina litorea TaxID=1515593 RepID=A0ABD6BPI0_9EURY|nr:DUF555 domain-containing protein [Halolamina litorea]
MDRRVVLEAAVPVFDVATPDAAVGAAISKVGKSLNPDLSYVNIEPRRRRSPRGDDIPPATVAAGEALVALELEMVVYDVASDEHAIRIARSEIGSRLDGISLERVSVGPVEDEPADEETAETSDPESDSDGSLLPEFEEMVERNTE